MDTLNRLIVQTVAMQEILVVMLARQAHASDDPEGEFRRLSNGLSHRVDKLASTFFSDDPVLLELAQAEIDRLLRTAQETQRLLRK